MSKSKLKFKELSVLTTDKLNGKVALFKRELFNLRFQRSMGEVSNSSYFRKIRRNIARVNTELAKRKIIGEKYNA
jgi:large subunit ribosomal protein L29